MPLLQSERRKDILAESSPCCETLTKEWTIVIVPIHGLYAIKDSIVDLGILLALEFDCRSCPIGPLIEYIAILVIYIQDGWRQGERTE